MSQPPSPTHGTFRRQLSSADSHNAARIRSKCGKFRTLIIGRANAGKTTILKRVCNTTEDPVIYDAKGKKTPASKLESSISRGLHNIEDEMVFKSNPGFRFHDSRGFEGGGVEELEKVIAFIESRSNEKKLPDQLHAIWYCIPVDDSRPFTTAETRFFSECGTGKVPVIVIFTKFDALENKAYAVLQKEGKTRLEAREQSPQHAITSFESIHLETLYKQNYPPKAHIYLRRMDKEGSKCDELIERTANALDSEALQQLLVSTQRNNVELYIRSAIEKTVSQEIERFLLTSKPHAATRKTESKPGMGMMRGILEWFPQYSFDFDFEDRDRDFQLDLERFQDLDLDFRQDFGNPMAAAERIYSRLFSQQERLDSVESLVYIGIVTAILADFGFLLWNDCRVDPLKGIDVYEKSTSIQAAIGKAANESFQIFVSEQAMDKLLQRTIQIALDNRLPSELLRDPIVTGEDPIITGERYPIVTRQGEQERGEGGQEREEGGQEREEGGQESRPIPERSKKGFGRRLRSWLRSKLRLSR